MYGVRIELVRVRLVRDSAAEKQRREHGLRVWELEAAFEDLHDYEDLGYDLHRVTAVTGDGYVLVVTFEWGPDVLRVVSVKPC
jgi:hypothetical protein